MKKKMKHLGIVFIIILSLVGIWFIFNYEKKYAKKEDNKEPQIIEGISMAIKEGTLTQSSATVVITDTIKGEDHTYGSDFRIEKKENNEWKKLDTLIKDYAFDLIGYGVNNNILEMDVKWDWLYGKLEQGEYRLIKGFAINKNDSYLGHKEIYVEFTID